MRTEPQGILVTGQLLAVVVAGALVAGCAGCAAATTKPALSSTTSDSASRGAGTVVAGSTPTTAAATAPAMDADHVPEPTGPAPEVADAVSRATLFVTAWARPSLDAAAWFAGVKDYLAPAAAALYISTDPANVPATAVTGPPVLGEASSSTATVRVPTNAGVVAVHLHYDPTKARWLVDRMDAAS